MPFVHNGVFNAAEITRAKANLAIEGRSLDQWEPRVHIEEESDDGGCPDVEGQTINTGRGIPGKEIKDFIP